MSEWIEQIFRAAQINKQGIVRRSIQSVRTYASFKELELACRRKKFHLIRNGGQYLIICNKGQFRLICWCFNLNHREAFFFLLPVAFCSVSVIDLRAGGAKVKLYQAVGVVYALAVYVVIPAMLFGIAKTAPKKLGRGFTSCNPKRKRKKRISYWIVMSFSRAKRLMILLSIC